jgi:hypothetical protein
MGTVPLFFCRLWNGNRRACAVFRTLRKFNPETSAGAAAAIG